jgi:hypothetical protein
MTKRICLVDGRRCIFATSAVTRSCAGGTVRAVRWGTSYFPNFQRLNCWGFRVAKTAEAWSSAIVHSRLMSRADDPKGRPARSETQRTMATRATCILSASHEGLK